MPLHRAGYDRISELVSTNGNAVATAGLMNCIGIVAYNPTHQTMAIAHFDTLHCYSQNGVGPFDLSTLLHWRNWLREQTGANSFAIGLGSIWSNTAPTNEGEPYSQADNWRFDLITKVKRVFHHEPIVVGKCIRFALVKGKPRMQGSMDETWMGPGRWDDDGNEIPYARLR